MNFEIQSYPCLLLSTKPICHLLFASIDRWKIWDVPLPVPLDKDHSSQIIYLKILHKRNWPLSSYDPETSSIWTCSWFVVVTVTLWCRILQPVLVKVPVISGVVKTMFLIPRVCREIWFPFKRKCISWFLELSLWILCFSLSFLWV